MKNAATALVALALLSGAVHGQNAPTTNAVNVTGTATSRLALEVAPEIRLQLLEAAAAEIGPVPANDLEDLIARHATEKAKFVTIQERKAKAAAAAQASVLVAATTPSRAVAFPASKTQQPQPLSAVDELDRAIAQLGSVRAKLAGETLKSAK